MTDVEVVVVEGKREGGREGRREGRRTDRFPPPQNGEKIVIAVVVEGGAGVFEGHPEIGGDEERGGEEGVWPEGGREGRRGFRVMTEGGREGGRERRR